MTRIRRTGSSPQGHGIDDVNVAVLGADGPAIAVLTCSFVEHLDTSQPDKAGVLDLLRGVAGRPSPT